MRNQLPSVQMGRADQSKSPTGDWKHNLRLGGRTGSKVYQQENATGPQTDGQRKTSPAFLSSSDSFLSQLSSSSQRYHHTPDQASRPPTPDAWPTAHWSRPGSGSSPSPSMWMLLASQDRPVYAPITNPNKSEWLQMTKLISCSCHLTAVWSWAQNFFGPWLPHLQNAESNVKRVK